MPLAAIDMDTISAGDIAVGQEWYEVVTQVHARARWRAIHIDDDQVTMEATDDPSADLRFVSFGALLSTWVLLA